MVKGSFNLTSRVERKPLLGFSHYQGAENASSPNHAAPKLPSPRQYLLLLYHYC